MAELTQSLSKYSVVLLSAGRGNRMGKIGKKIPKCLININNKTIISKLIEILKLKGLKEVNIILGYKYRTILKELKKIKNIKVNYIVIKDYINTGSVYSLYNFKKLWIKKKPVIMFHTDIIFDPKFLENILLSKKKNLIGVKKTKITKLKQNKFVVKTSKSMKVLKIDKYKNCKPAYGEVLCINKFSAGCFKKFISFLKIYFKKETNNITWEYPLSDFVNKNDFYVLRNQSFKWANINTMQDLNQARKDFI